MPVPNKRIFLDKTMPNGALGKVHTLDELTIRDSVIALVTSRTAEDGAICWQERIELPYSVVEIDPRNSVLDHLVETGGYLEGGVVADAPLPLDLLRSQLLVGLTQLRDSLLNGGVDIPGYGRIDTDMVSRQNLSGAVSAAILAKQSAHEYNLRWRMQDNSYIDLSADDVISLGLSVAAFVSHIYQISFSVKDSITRATTLEELEAINIATANWAGVAEDNEETS